MEVRVSFPASKEGLYQLESAFHIVTKKTCLGGRITSLVKKNEMSYDVKMETRTVQSSIIYSTFHFQSFRTWCQSPLQKETIILIDWMLLAIAAVIFGVINPWCSVLPWQGCQQSYDLERYFH